MRIKIDKDWLLISDSKNYILVRKYKDKDGEERESQEGFFSNIETLLEVHKDRIIRGSDITTWGELKALLVDLRRLYADIRDQMGAK